MSEKAPSRIELLRGTEFTTDAALVTLDFLQRRGLLG